MDTHTHEQTDMLISSCLLARVVMAPGNV